MNVLIFQHAAEEAPGTLLDWLNTRKLKSTVHHWYRDNRAPDSEDYDWLIVLGGAMNLDDEAEHPWLKEEKRYLQEWLESEKPILGICLGSQLLAQALGGKVVKNPQREIGFLEVTKNANRHPAFKRWPQSTRVYQYHEDSFSIPPGCTNLLSSPGCAHQAFALDENEQIMGLQFHPESTREWILGNARSVHARQGEPYVQNPAETAAEIGRHLPPMTTNFFRLLDDFSEGLR